MHAKWNKTFERMATWGMKNIHVSCDDLILDIGCGAATVHTLA